MCMEGPSVRPDHTEWSQPSPRFLSQTTHYCPRLTDEKTEALERRGPTQVGRGGVGPDPGEQDGLWTPDSPPAHLFTPTEPLPLSETVCLN